MTSEMGNVEYLADVSKVLSDRRLILNRWVRSKKNDYRLKVGFGCSSALTFKE